MKRRGDTVGTPVLARSVRLVVAALGLLVALGPASSASVKIRTPDVARWATVLCKFKGKDTVAHPKSYYENLMSGTRPGMMHYFEDVSYGRVDLRPSRAFGWFRLPRTHRSYLNEYTGREFPYDVAMDCLHAADRSVDFDPFYGINVWVNGKLSDRAWGARYYIRLNERGNYGVAMFSEPNTWYAEGDPPNGVVAHEMGHAFGLKHSSNARNEPYSHWDVMGSMCGYHWDEETPCIPVHPNAFMKYRLGWITEEETYTARAGTDRTVTVVPMSTATTGGNYRMAKVPLPDKPGYFTVEVRDLEGYDSSLWGEAVIIFRWDPNAPPEIGPYLIGRTYANGGLDWSGEMWAPGETYNHKGTGISIAILAENADGSYEVRVKVPSV